MRRTILVLAAFALLFTASAAIGHRPGIGPTPTCPWPGAPGCDGDYKAASLPIRA